MLSLLVCFSVSNSTIILIPVGHLNFQHLHPHSSFEHWTFFNLRLNLTHQVLPLFLCQCRQKDQLSLLLNLQNFQLHRLNEDLKFFPTPQRPLPSYGEILELENLVLDLGPDLDHHCQTQLLQLALLYFIVDLFLSSIDYLSLLTNRQDLHFCLK